MTASDNGTKSYSDYIDEIAPKPRPSSWATDTQYADWAIAHPDVPALLRLWLIDEGVSERKAYKALPSTLGKAYCIRGNYLAKLKETEFRGAGAKSSGRDAVAITFDDDTKSLLGAGDAEKAQEAFDASYTSFEPPTEPTQPAAKATVFDRVDLARAVEAVIGPKIEAAKVELTTVFDRAIANLKLSETLQTQIRDLVSQRVVDELARLAKPQTIEVFDRATGQTTDVGLQHDLFPKLLRLATARDHRGYRLNIWLTGPTGSGKTTAGENVATALAGSFQSYQAVGEGWNIFDRKGNPVDLNGLAHDGPFGADSSLDADYKVVGFKDANGKFHWTTFLRVFAFGGIYIADEIDNWMPSALVALNAALANGWISTPLGIIRRHRDCCIIAAANTWGTGATNDYVGRTKLDAATINRFPTKLDWPVDERLELAIAENLGGSLGVRWAHLIQAARRNVRTAGLQIIISPRNTYDGIALLRIGFSAREVAEMNFLAGLKPEQKAATGVDHLLDIMPVEVAA